MAAKSRLSFWQIWNMSFGFLGIQFGWGLQMANMSAIYTFLGASEEKLSWLWIAAPLTGLIVQPVVGYLSDRTWCGLGRRRPYFLIGAILASLALLAMPHSSELWMAVGLLWVLDASINVTMEPFRAFVADKLPHEQRGTGFSVQSLFIGLGAFVSSMMPWMLTNWFGVAPGAADGGKIPTAVMISFHIGAAALFIAVVHTILTTPEDPPEDLAAFRKMKADSPGPFHFFRETFHGLARMPETMRKLAWVQSFTWLGLFCMWIYWAPAIARHSFGGDPADKAAWQGVMEQAGEWTGVCFAGYNLACFVFSFVLIGLARRFHVRNVHFVCLLLGGMGLLWPAIFPARYQLLGGMVLVGIAWASILSMPYAMLAHCLPTGRMGFYMGVFNFFIVLPQVAVALLMGPAVTKFFGGDSLGALVTGGASMVLAALLVLRVRTETVEVTELAVAGH